MHVRAYTHTIYIKYIVLWHCSSGACNKCGGHTDIWKCATWQWSICNNSVGGCILCLRFAYCRCWRYKFSGMWHSSIGRVVPDVWGLDCQELLSHCHSKKSQETGIFTIQSTSVAVTAVRKCVRACVRGVCVRARVCACVCVRVCARARAWFLSCL